jgi:hypothetical protein
VKQLLLGVLTKSLTAWTSRPVSRGALSAPRPTSATPPWVLGVKFDALSPARGLPPLRRERKTGGPWEARRELELGTDPSSARLLRWPCKVAHGGGRPCKPKFFKRRSTVQKLQITHPTRRRIAPATDRTDRQRRTSNLACIPWCTLWRLYPWAMPHH